MALESACTRLTLLIRICERELEKKDQKIQHVQELAKKIADQALTFSIECDELQTECREGYKRQMKLSLDNIRLHADVREMMADNVQCMEKIEALQKEHEKAIIKRDDKYRQLEQENFCLRQQLELIQKQLQASHERMEGMEQAVMTQDGNQQASNSKMNK